MESLTPGGNERPASFTLFRSLVQINCKSALDFENSYFISTCISDLPAEDVEVIFSTSCICCSARSMGSVTSSATSNGLAPG